MQEVIAPSGATSCSGPPDGSDQSSTKGKLRDQIIISRPSWIPAESVNYLTFATPYYFAQIIMVAFATTVSAAEVKLWLRYVINSIYTGVWTQTMLPSWINPAENIILNDLGQVVTVPFPMAVGWHCPRLLRQFFSDGSQEPELIRQIREIRRWGRYVTITPVANATEFKGRIATAQLQFNSALNPLHFTSGTGVPPPSPPPDPPEPPAGWESFQIGAVILETITGRFWYYNGSWWRGTFLTQITYEEVYAFDVYDTDENLVVPANTPFTVTVTSNATENTMQVTWLVNGLTTTMILGTPPLWTNLLRRPGTTTRAAATDSDEIARYAVTPEFSFEALLQADEKSYSNNWIEGSTSRISCGKDHLDFVATREWRPLIRAPNGGKVVIDPASIKRDLVDTSAKWQVVFAAGVDPNASLTLIYGSHSQFCAETDSPLMMFKRPPPDKDEGALEMAQQLQAVLPHTFPAKFNDGGILPMILARVKSAGAAGLAGVARNIVGQLMGSLQTIGTADRVIGYPSMSTMYGNNPVAMYAGNGRVANGNGNGKGRKKKRGQGVLSSLLTRTMNI